MNRFFIKKLYRFSAKVLMFSILLQVFVFTNADNLYALSHEWVGVPKSNFGEQLWDKKVLQEIKMVQ